MRRTWLGMLIVGLAAAPSAFAQEPPAEPEAADPARSEAQEHFNLGPALMENENWDAARL